MADSTGQLSAGSAFGLDDDLSWDALHTNTVVPGLPEFRSTAAVRDHQQAPPLAAVAATVANSLTAFGPSLMFNSTTPALVAPSFSAEDDWQILEQMHQAFMFDGSALPIHSNDWPPPHQRPAGTVALLPPSAADGCQSCSTTQAAAVPPPRANAFDVLAQSCMAAPGDFVRAAWHQQQQEVLQLPSVWHQPSNGSSNHYNATGPPAGVGQLLPPPPPAAAAAAAETDPANDGHLMTGSPVVSERPATATSASGGSATCSLSGPTAAPGARCLAAFSGSAPAAAAVASPVTRSGGLMTKRHSSAVAGRSLNEIIPHQITATSARSAAAAAAAMLCRRSLSGSGSIKRSRSQQMGGSSDVSPAAAATASGGDKSAAAAGGCSERLCKQSCKGQRISRSRHDQEIGDLKNKIVQLMAQNTRLQEKSIALTASEHQLLERVAILTEKWRASVAANQHLECDNIAARQELMTLRHQQHAHNLQQQQQQH